MQAWGISDPGCVRSQNQDAYDVQQFDGDCLLCIVCDGMGGAKSGNVASALATEVFTQEVARSRRPGMSQEKIGQMLLEAAQLANITVFDQARESEEFTGMGTTLVAAYVEKDTAVLINVGDSPGVSAESGRRAVGDQGSFAGAADGAAGGADLGAGQELSR